MGEHPEFPQESPAIKYIVDQVSKVEDVSNCSLGYYKSVQSIISRLDKTDVALNKLTQTTTDLKKITDSDIIKTVIGEKSDEINTTIYSGLKESGDQLNQTLSANLIKMRSDFTPVITAINDTNRKSKDIQKELEDAVLIITARLDAHVKDMSERVSPPVWKIWLYILISLIIGATLTYGLMKYGIMV
jgi:hypothetical protein